MILKDGDGRMPRKRVLMAIMAASVVGGLAACSSSSSSPSASGASSGSSKTITDVTFGYPDANINFWASARMAYDPGFCAPYGVKVTPEVLNSTSITPAIDSNQVNFAFTSGVGLTAMAKGLIHNEKVVAYLGLNSPASVYGIWAGPQVTTASQLVGKTLGATSPTSPIYLGAVALLQHAGISLNQVHFTFISSNSGVWEALAHGTIAGSWNNGPAPTANAAANDHIVIPLTSDPSVEAIDSFFMIGNSSFMSAHPAATKGVMECLAAATKAGRSTDPATLSAMQSALAKMVDNSTLAEKAWPQNPISAGVLPMDAANVAKLQASMNMQLQKTIPASTIAGMVDATAMNGVTPVSVINYAGTSQYPLYSGK
jgi:ABC-type nitrate/sulfonate/bicarbonate transport system substrate-binding protein